MKRILLSSIIGILIILSASSYGINFVIQTIRVGPNPLVRAKDALIVNYVATKPHTADYYLYSITGELIIQKSFQENISGVTNAGECQFELVDIGTLSSLPKQLYIVVMEFDDGESKIQGRKYVIIK